MTLDLTFRAENPFALAYALKRPFAAHLGVEFPLGPMGNEIINPSLWSPNGVLGTDLRYHYIRPNGLMVEPATYSPAGEELTPIVTDPACWLLLRLIRDAASADFEEDATEEPDNWRRSKAIRLIRAGGIRADWRGVRARQYAIGNGGAIQPEARGKKVQILRGSALAALDIFPAFLGGGAF